MSASEPTMDKRVYVFLGLACAITWALDLPFAFATLTGATPPPWSLGLAGLGAWGPTIAAVIVAGKGQRSQPFGPWRTSMGASVMGWCALALFVPLLLHVPATALEVALGGSPAAWIYWPSRPEHVAALVMFSFGEEFGWRGFAQPRLIARHGPVVGPLLLGLVWAVWHLLMMISPETGAFDGLTMATTLIELPLYSVIFAWFSQRTGGSIAVAIALHMGAHLDNTSHTPDDELRIRVLRLAVLAVATALAARSLLVRSAGAEPKP